MGRILAIDYGTKRCGIAVTDSLCLIATGLKTISTIDLMTFLEKYFSEENVSTVVVGEPKKMNNLESQSEQHIRGFIRKFKTKFKNIPTERVDERFTSKMASSVLHDMGYHSKQKKVKHKIDEISAVIILQSYLEKINNLNINKT